jgi:DNA-directed RNA polymerase subunit omega
MEKGTKITDKVRLEKVVAKALERMDHDRYKFSRAVGIRAKQIHNGSAPLVDMDPKQHKATDIAIYEIAEGKLIIEES